MRILIMFTGGTIGSGYKDGYIAPDDDAKERLLACADGVDFETASPFTMLSENMDLMGIFKIADAIRAAQGFDGIIVTHGTDTLQYTSSALGYIFADCKIPIVLVSSNYILSDMRANGRENFRAAVAFIKSKAANGVFVSYKNSDECPKIHAATRLMPHSLYSDRLYSVKDLHFGKIQCGEFVKNSRFTERADKAAPITERVKSDVKVLSIGAYTGIQSALSALDLHSLDAIIVTAYHSGTLPEDFHKYCASFQKNIYLCGSYMDVPYESMKETRGIIALPVASPIAMYTKLSLLIAAGREGDMCRRIANDF